ncbi:unnamed protein product [Miscanthus lutarioriparius]|uniref:Uncharacterized protein n=1 Tax=Miscanthus lutarioriparius TaxID=422564 RepID=A0A811N804_9POAL|nr:unnamed protein product [Miscanthus lutarioriparius]
MPISPTEKEMPRHRRYRLLSSASRSVRSPDRAESWHLKPWLVMRSSSTETEIHGHGRLKRSSSSKDARADASHCKAPRTMRISSTEIEVSGQGRLKRSSSSEAASASYPTWVILNRVGPQRDSFHGDATTSFVSYTSGGDQVSVSFVLEKSLRTSLVTLDWPQGPRPSEGSTSKPHVLAAHRNVVLLEIISRAKGMIVAHITHPGNGSTDLQESVLRYVPLPVDPVQDNPYDNDYGRGIEDALELPVVFVTTTMASSSS